MLPGNRKDQKRRSTSGTPKDAQPFDPTAYAALIAIAAAEKRLRASNSRAGSSSTARPSSLPRPRDEVSPDPYITECNLPPSALPTSALHRSTLTSKTDGVSVAAATSASARGSRRVEDIVARYRAPQQPAPVPNVTPSSSRTLLEQLAALGSESDSSVASEVGSHSVAEKDHGVTAVELSAERSDSTPMKVSLRSPVAPMQSLHDATAAAARSTSQLSSSPSASPPATDPDLTTGAVQPTKQLFSDTGLIERRESLRNGEEEEEDQAAVILRDASPLREQSVAGMAGMTYRVSTVESVHAVAAQLNFALYD